MELELHQIELKYEGLRILEQNRQARLAASLSEYGQRSPVLVVRGESDRYILIDGYRRLAALRKLGVDTVEAVSLPMSEMDALVFGHRQERHQKRTALEDGWLVMELMECYRLSMQEVAVRLLRSKSWVSRRVALVKDLPSSVQELVRMGKLCAHAAMKYLVPLARANSADCRKLAKGIGGHHLSARQVRQLYVAWRLADEEERQRIVENPLLYLKAVDEALRPVEEDPEASQRQALLKDLEIVGGVCHRARRRVREVILGTEHPGYRKKVEKSWRGAQLAFDQLMDTMEESCRAG